MDYNYDSLATAEFRVLELQPGEFDDDPIISLHTETLLPSPSRSYEALSYVWGSEDSLQRVLIKASFKDAAGKRELYSINVTHNLAEVLRYLRQKDRKRTLWIDALCINQKSMEERAEQVKMMPQIYSGARHTVIWLGPAADDSDFILEKFADWAAAAEFHPITNTLATHTTHMPEHAWLGDRYGEMPDSRALSACILMFDRPWFERLWIRQELFLTADKASVACGHHVVSWQVFRVGLIAYCQRVYNAKTHNSIPEPNKLSMLETLLPRGETPLVFLLHFIRLARCKDPRDRIFGVLGMLGSSQSHILEQIEVTYKITVEDLYRQVALLVINADEHLESLLFCRPSLRTLSVPSWVPDWSYAPDHPDAPKRIVPFQYADAFCAMDPVKYDATTLVVKGVLPSRIEYITSNKVGQSDATSSFVECAAILKLSYQELLAYANDSISEDKLFGLIAKTLEVDEVKDNMIFHSDYAFGKSLSSADLKRATEKLISATDDELKSLASSQEYIWKAIFEIIQLFWQSRRLALLSSGQVILVPRDTKVGDAIAIMIGAPIVAVVRDFSNIAETYELVGFAFAPGFNWGEALLGPFPPPWDYVCLETETTRYTAFRNSETGTLTALDPRVDWADLRVDDDDPRKSIFRSTMQDWETLRPKKGDPFYEELSRESLGSLRRMDENYLIKHGVNLRRLRLV